MILVRRLPPNSSFEADLVLVAAIELLLHERDVVPEHADAVEAALDLFREKPSLGFSDCLMLELARKAGHLPLGTFDRNLGRVEGAQKL